MGSNRKNESLSCGFLTFYEAQADSSSTSHGECSWYGASTTWWENNISSWLSKWYDICVPTKMFCWFKEWSCMFTKEISLFFEVAYMIMLRDI